MIVALIVRKKASIDPGLCEEHLHKRRLWITIGWVGTLVTLCGFPIGAVLLGYSGGVGLALGVLCFLVLVIVSMVKARILYPRRIDERYARLQGAGERFLASLPNFT